MRQPPDRGLLEPSGPARAASLLLALGLLAGCERSGDHPALARGEGGRPGGPSGSAVPVAVARARTGEIASHYTATATLEVEKEAQILARVRGLVRSIAVEEGDSVSEGDVLLEIENEEYAYLLRKAEAAAGKLRDQVARLREMSAELVSAEELETAERELSIAEAEEDLARLSLSYTKVTAPFSGRIVSRLAEIGQNVSVGTALFALADFKPLLARVHIPSREFRKIHLEQPVELALDSTGQRLRGSIARVSPTIDAKTGTIKVTIEVPEYPDGTRPGDFAEVGIVTETHSGATLVPRIAAISDKGETVVYVDRDGLAERRVVTVGFTTDEESEILDGVQPGDRVVVKGQRSLEHGAPLEVLSDESTGREPAANSSP